MGQVPTIILSLAALDPSRVHLFPHLGSDLETLGSKS